MHTYRKLNILRYAIRDMLPAVQMALPSDLALKKPNFRKYRNECKEFAIRNATPESAYWNRIVFDLSPLQLDDRCNKKFAAKNVLKIVDCIHHISSAYISFDPRYVAEAASDLENCISKLVPIIGREDIAPSCAAMLMSRMCILALPEPRGPIPLVRGIGYQEPTNSIVRKAEVGISYAYSVVKALFSNTFTYSMFAVTATTYRPSIDNTADEQHDIKSAVNQLPLIDDFQCMMKDKFAALKRELTVQHDNIATVDCAVRDIRILMATQGVPNILLPMRLSQCIDSDAFLVSSWEWLYMRSIQVSALR